MIKHVMTRCLAVGLGAIGFVVAHAIEVAKWTAWFGGAEQPWFLNSGQAAMFTLGSLLIVGLLAGWFRLSSVMVAAGAFVAMTMTLLLIEGGPGTIFPIVLAGGGLLIVAVILLGGWLGSLVN